LVWHRASKTDAKQETMFLFGLAQKTDRGLGECKKNMRVQKEEQQNNQLRGYKINNLAESVKKRGG